MKIEVISRDSMKKFFKRVEDAEKLSESIDPFKLDEIAIISINSYSGCPYLDDLTRMGVKLTERDLEPSPVPEKFFQKLGAAPDEIRWMKGRVNPTLRKPYIGVLSLDEVVAGQLKDTKTKVEEINIPFLKPRSKK